MANRSNVPVDVYKYIETHNFNLAVCWPFIGTLGGRDGRGYLRLNGKKQLAHRIVYALHYGEIPDKMVIRHKCDVPNCCNHTHLELGTRAQNEQDKFERDRSGVPLDALKTIRRFSAMKMSYPRICTEVEARHGIVLHPTTVGKIVRGNRRKGHE